jgi:hypothetical protein
MINNLIKISCILMLSSCVSRQEVLGQLWLFDKLPDSVCREMPELKSLGVYRVVSCKQFPNPKECSNGEKDYEAVISYCSKRIIEFKAAEDKYIEQWLKKLGSPKK